MPGWEKHWPAERDLLDFQSKNLKMYQRIIQFKDIGIEKQKSKHSVMEKSHDLVEKI